MARRDPAKWDALTPAYRRRLTRHGITRDAYVSGANLKQARGHIRTPENRAEVARHPERFRTESGTGWLDRREALQQRAIRNLRYHIGHGFASEEVDRFDGFTIAQNVGVAPNDILEIMADADLYEIQEYAARRDLEHEYFIDGVLQKRNLWWYH